MTTASTSARLVAMAHSLLAYAPGEPISFEPSMSFVTAVDGIGEESFDRDLQERLEEDVGRHPPAVETFTGTPRLGELPIHVYRDVGLDRARSPLVRRNQASDGRFDERGIVGIEEGRRRRGRVVGWVEDSQPGATTAAAATAPGPVEE
jgi:hypothetical protein